jgi:hypothetical protein
MVKYLSLPWKNASGSEQEKRVGKPYDPIDLAAYE